MSRPVAQETEVSISVGAQAPLRAAVYRPSGSSAGTIVAIHGMSPLAERDARWVQLCRGACRAGLTVISPRFESVASLRITADQPSLFAATARAICDTPALAPAGRVGLLSVSFSGGLTIAAAASEPLRGRVSGVCAIGGYADLPTCLRSIFAAQDSDPYALLIVMANFLAGASAPIPGAGEALFQAARANFADITIDPRDHFGEIPDTTRALLHDLLADRGLRLATLDRIERDCADTIRALDPIHLLDGLDAPVTLLHGAHDEVIPPGQSRAMATAVRALGLPCDLVVTDILSHGDTAVSPSLLARDGPAVVRAFGSFLQACSD
jgi:pimeloyl-ACP methyl ester carboxylesterase